MKAVTILGICVLLLVSSALAHDGVHDDKKKEGEQRGYVLKVGEGEVLGADIIKASPRSGTQGSVMVYGEEPEGSTSGLHYHVKADEFFYVLKGRGTITLGKEDIAIGPGDTIFVPVGTDHRITSSKDDPLTVIFILDRPGIAEQFRLKLDREKMSLEEFNAIVRKYGTVYKSFD